VSTLHEDQSLLNPTLQASTPDAKDCQPQNRVLCHFPNIAYNVIGIAASQGGLRAIKMILAALPPDFPAAIVVVQHLSPSYPSYLTSILSRSTSLSVKQAEPGDWLQPGMIYTPVPNQHLLVNPEGTLSLSDSAKVNFARPAADKLFWSLALSYQMRAIAVVLTGRNTDGALGALAIKKHGGTVIAQNEASSECFIMPQATIATGKVDWVLPLESIAPMLTRLVTTNAPQLRSQHRLH
jgi:two-component system chemotaxis response regulator CheB